MGKLKRRVLIQRDTVCFNIDNVISYIIDDNGTVDVKTTGNGRARFNERELAFWQVVDMPEAAAEDFMNEPEEPAEGEM